jgi:hypothetical protein
LLTSVLGLSHRRSTKTLKLPLGQIISSYEGLSAAVSDLVAHGTYSPESNEAAVQLDLLVSGFLLEPSIYDGFGVAQLLGPDTPAPQSFLRTLRSKVLDSGLVELDYLFLLGSIADVVESKIRMFVECNDVSGLRRYCKRIIKFGKVTIEAPGDVLTSLLNAGRYEMLECLTSAFRETALVGETLSWQPLTEAIKARDAAAVDWCVQRGYWFTDTSEDCVINGVTLPCTAAPFLLSMETNQPELVVNLLESPLLIPSDLDHLLQHGQDHPCWPAVIQVLTDAGIDLRTAWYGVAHTKPGAASTSIDYRGFPSQEPNGESSTDQRFFQQPIQVTSEEAPDLGNSGGQTCAIVSPVLNHARIHLDHGDSIVEEAPDLTSFAMQTSDLPQRQYLAKIKDYIDNDVWNIINEGACHPMSSTTQAHNLLQWEYLTATDYDISISNYKEIPDFLSSASPAHDRTSRLNLSDKVIDNDISEMSKESAQFMMKLLALDQRLKDLNNQLMTSITSSVNEFDEASLCHQRKGKRIVDELKKLCLQCKDLCDDSALLGSLSPSMFNHDKVWRSGIASVRKLYRGETPGSLRQVIKILLVAYSTWMTSSAPTVSEKRHL